MIEKIKNIKHLNSNNFFLMAGPCAIEGEEMAFEIAEKIFEISNRLEIPFIFKGSFKKANRSRIDSFTGVGDEKALNILKKVKKIIFVSEWSRKRFFLDIDKKLFSKTDVIYPSVDIKKSVKKKKYITFYL